MAERHDDSTPCECGGTCDTCATAATATFDVGGGRTIAFDRVRNVLAEHALTVDGATPSDAQIDSAAADVVVAAGLRVPPVPTITAPDRAGDSDAPGNTTDSGDDNSDDVAAGVGPGAKPGAKRPAAPTLPTPTASAETPVDPEPDPVGTGDGDATDPAPAPDGDEAPETLATATAAPIDPNNPGRFTAVLVVEEEATPDGRIIQKGATTWRQPPLPLMCMLQTASGHDGATVAAVIEKIRRSGNQILGEGRFDTSDMGIEAARLVRDGVLTGVSIDGGDVEYDIEILVGDDGEETGVQYRITAILILGATICPFQAIGGAQIQYVTASADGTSLQIVGRITWAAGDDEEDAPALPDASTLVAAGPRVFPAAYFTDPAFTAPTPIRVFPEDSDGVCRVWGHLAVWGECHIGLAGCTIAPHSKTGYAYFKTGAVHTDAGERPVGTISLSANHAGRNLSPQAAAAHYDNSALAAAYVEVGEDAHGIWVAGVLAPGLSTERATELAAASLSGDWRRIGGNLELVAALAVNVPGFPVIGMRDGEQVALVAAGYGPQAATRESIQRQVDAVDGRAQERYNALEREIQDLRDALERHDTLLRPIAQERLAARVRSLVTIRPDSDDEPVAAAAD